MIRRAVAAAALLIAGLGAPLAEAGDRTAGEWLEQMTRALASLNYEPSKGNRDRIACAVEIEASAQVMTLGGVERRKEGA